MTQMNLRHRKGGRGKRTACENVFSGCYSHGRTGEEADLAHAAKVAQVREEPHDQGDSDGPDDGRLGSAANRLNGGSTSDAMQACNRGKKSLVSRGSSRLSSARVREQTHP